MTPSTAATAEDRKVPLNPRSKIPPEFYDKVRPLFIAADHQHATVLVELIRTRDFHSDTGGEVIYRVELWYFENLFGGWAKDANTERVIAASAGIRRRWSRIWQFVPALGGLPAVAEASTAPASGPATAAKTQVVTLPEKPDPRHGVVGESSNQISMRGRVFAEEEPPDRTGPYLREGSKWERSGIRAAAAIRS